MTIYEELGDSIIAGDGDKVKEEVNILLKKGDRPVKDHFCWSYPKHVSGWAKNEVWRNVYT